MALKSVKFTLNGQSYDLTLDAASGQYKATISAPSTSSWGQTDHKYQGSITAEDAAGNKTTATATDFPGLALRVLEKTKPTISVSYPTAGAYIGSNKPTVRWTVTDADSGIDKSTISVQLDGGTATTSGITTAATTNGFTCTYTPGTALTEGAHTVKFAVSDNDGNAATAVSVAFTVDTVPPVLNVTAPTDNLVTNKAALAVTGTTNDATSSPVSVRVRVGSGGWTTATVGSNGAFSVNVSLAEGVNIVTVEATDSAGKTTTVARTVTLDTTPPTITAITLTPNPVDAGKTYVISVAVTD